VTDILAYGSQNAERIRQALGHASGQNPATSGQNPANVPAPELVLTPPEDAKAAKKVRHLEAAQQMDYMDRVRRCLDPDGRALPGRPGADLIFALANENAAGRAIGVVRWKMGVRPGLPDLGIFVPRNRYHGAFIEMKQSGGVASDVRPAQRECQESLNRTGYRAVVCYGWWDAWKFTCDYLGWDQ
jgi:hypothetical protein